jgi:hypothetical protein
MAWIAELILTAIAEAAAADCFTARDIERATGMSAKQVENAVGKLRRHDLVQLVTPGCLRITEAGRAAAAGRARIRSGPRGQQPGARGRADGLRVRAWRAMRLRRKFSVGDLVALCAQGDERNPESNLLKYIRALTRAGILVELARRETPLSPTSNGAKRWWLMESRDPGPLAPSVRWQRNQVYDPNSEVLHDMA